MTHHVTAVIIDNALVDPRPTLVECETEDWRDAIDAVLSEYAVLRGGMRNFDLDALEIRSMALIRRP